MARAIALEPEAIDAYFQLASAWHTLRNPQRAIDAMMRARDVRPGTAAIYYNIGMLSAQQGQRYVARTHLWEALRLLGHDAGLASKQQFVETVFLELDRLGPITQHELSQIPKQQDARGNLHNPELLRCLKELDGPRSPALTLRFYVALLRSHVLVPTTHPGRPDPSESLKDFRPELVRGPDRRWWFPLFTDIDAARAQASRNCASMTAIQVAQLALAAPDVTGLVVNPTAAGGGQPIEHPGVEALAKGSVLRVRV